MANENAIFMKFSELQELANGDISGSFAAVGAATSFPIRQYIVSNLTNVPLYFSFDGVINHIELLAYTQFVSDISTNRVGPSDALMLGTNVTLYVKDQGVAATAGHVSFATMYASGVAKISQ